MTDVEYKNTLYEVDEVLSILDKSLIEKIPESIRNYIKLNKAKYYNFKLDHSKKLSEQKLLKTTEQYLTMLYLKFICNEKEKQEVLEVMAENERKYKEELTQKYHSNVDNNNFPKIEKEISKEKENIIAKSNEISIIPKKDNLFRKIINKIKAFLANKN